MKNNIIIAAKTFALKELKGELSIEALERHNYKIIVFNDAFAKWSMEKRTEKQSRGVQMMYYNECSICGAALDPGERCDCEREQDVHQEEEGVKET